MAGTPSFLFAPAATSAERLVGRARPRNVKVATANDIIASRRTVAPPITLGDFGEDMDLMANPILTMPDFGEDMDLAANPVLTMYVPDFGDDIDLSANPVLTCKSA
uniref:Uncharacterized protein n=1 Tax=Florenciella parvula TaxID=236787 RepID=A0A7S2G6K4_9STRA|mmetsp:Transcript_4622/g.9518  ORF Transcript_4622/g.9518 Transcript_4622/m.9518 type:complete len:106 (+) Transcript_4622:264-581(+)